MYELTLREVRYCARLLHFTLVCSYIFTTWIRLLRNLFFLGKVLVVWRPKDNKNENFTDIFLRSCYGKRCVILSSGKWTHLAHWKRFLHTHLKEPTVYPKKKYLTLTWKNNNFFKQKKLFYLSLPPKKIISFNY